MHANDRRKKVLADDHDSDSDHGDFDPNALREHEEFTKAGAHLFALCCLIIV
jgi:hypothetical protein